jgi:hypothetical protein
MRTRNKGRLTYTRSRHKSADIGAVTGTVASYRISSRRCLWKLLARHQITATLDITFYEEKEH